MKTTFELDASELKAAIEMWMQSKGMPVTDADEFTVDEAGNVTIVVTAVTAPKVPVVVVSGPVVVPVSPAAPTAPVIKGHAVTADPPFSATVWATVFGLNYDGSVDQADNGSGFFDDPATIKPYNTRDKTLVGCSLPREVLLSTFLGIDSWRTENIDSVWSKNASVLRQWVDGNKPLLTMDSGGLSVFDVPIVDAGPTSKTGNGIDLTYATAHALKTNGSALATYEILLGGKPVEIKGWKFSEKKVG